MRSRLGQIAFRTSLIFWIASVLWILLSDRILELLVRNPDTLTALQTYKGWAFVTATAFLLYFLLKAQLTRWELESRERKRAEDALIESEQRYRSLFENSIDGILLTVPDGQILAANPEACRILGRTEDELRKVGRSGVVDSEDPRLAAALEERRRTGRVRGELTLVRKDGSKIPAEVSSAVLKDGDGKERSSMIIRDITEQKRAEEALRLWVAALQSAANAIVITDRDGAILFVNAAFTQLTGYSEEEAIGRNPRILKSGKSPVSFYKGLWDTILSGKVWHGQLVNKRKDGSLYDEEMTVTPVRNGNEVTNFIAIKNDISERKRLQEQLIQSQKMESIGVLAAGIAHDFNNVLGIIMGHSSLMQRVDSGNERITNGVKAIGQAAERGASLVRQMLTFARKTDISFALLSLNDSVMELQKLFYETFPRTITLVCNLEDDLPLVTADSTQVHQVLLNLSVNARDAMEGSGALIITTETAAGEKARSRFPDASAASYAVVTVTDNGQGMDDETRQHIFEPFFTTKGPGKGTGLGLSVVFGIMENHKGFIDVKSEPGHGTTFSLYFPVDSDAAKDAEPGDTIERRMTGGKETILVVEDEDMLRELAESVLTSKGYNVVAASDGEEAVEIYERQWKEIDLVFSDYGLPKLSGSEVLKRMKTINPEVKFIFATGFVDPDRKSTLLRNGAKEVILKPYKPAEIVDKVRDILDL